MKIPGRIGLITSGQLHEFERAVKASLEQRGMTVASLGRMNGANGIVDSDDVLASDRLLFIGPMQSHFIEIQALDGIRRKTPLPPVAYWFTEQVPNPDTPGAIARYVGQVRYKAGGTSDRPLPAWRWREIGELFALSRITEQFVIHTFSDTNTHFLQRLGLPAKTTAWGYHEKMGVLRQLHFSERDIDVLFIGRSNDNRRGPIITTIMNDLGRRNINVQVVDEGNPLFGDQRTDILNRAKINLCIGRQHWDDHVFRMLLGGANGALNITETSQPCQGPFAVGEDFDMAEIRALPNRIAFLLSNPDLMAHMAMHAHQKTMAFRLEDQVTQLFPFN